MLKPPEGNCMVRSLPMADWTMAWGEDFSRAAGSRSLASSAKYSSGKALEVVCSTQPWG